SEEQFQGVTIGDGADAPNSLVLLVNAGSRNQAASSLVQGDELDKAKILDVPQGKTTFRYLDCQGARFDQARFDQAYFPNGICGEGGVFDVSRFTDVPPEQVRTVFASSEPLTDPPVRIDVRWVEYKPGSFVVNLPDDLQPRFGGRFNEARFGQSKDEPELFQG